MSMLDGKQGHYMEKRDRKVARTERSSQRYAAFQKRAARRGWRHAAKAALKEVD